MGVYHQGGGAKERKKTPVPPRKHKGEGGERGRKGSPQLACRSAGKRGGKRKLLALHSAGKFP